MNTHTLFIRKLHIRHIFPAPLQARVNLLAINAFAGGHAEQNRTSEKAAANKK